ncbi:hypothetical protein AB0D04_18655 [Streptomyces sp. NPDC048483]|uniref:hypothetical protein n=1 Tax=Streptomyces sp. NPDC048483 TaxID=3154927 RepID=UPI00342808CC
MKTLRPEAAIALMEAAGDARLNHQGNADWMRKNSQEFADVYLVPLHGHRLRSGHLRCAVVLMGRKNDVVWMSLDVSPWKSLSLPGVRAREMVGIVGKLAARHPVVKWDGTLTDGTPADGTPT